jgi:predicted flavoprotein YhiN
MSGPAILKLSAWGARILHEKNYQFSIAINWLNDIEADDAEKILKELKLEQAKKAVSKKSPFELTNRLWESLVMASGIDSETKWADLSKNQLQNLSNQLTNCVFQVNGKSTFKEEFVTAGGIDLKEINFKTMESKLHENLYFAGEIVNIGKNLYIYNIHSSPNLGNPKMVSFHSIKTLSGQNNIDLKLFLNFLKERNVISDIHYINDIEFGTEIINGKGEVRVNSYSVTVK